MTLDQFICFKPGPRQRWLVIVAAWAGVLLIGVAHYATGPRIALYAFYLAPILVVTWFIGPRWGALTALLSALNWLVVDIGLLPEWQAESVVFINEGLRFGMYMLLVIVAWQWRKALDRETALARLDTLTQLPNRRAFFELARVELERARRYGRVLTAVMLDLDNFKAVNDQMGHQSGDELLRAISAVLRRETRLSDVVGRLGGDEFALVLPETDAGSALAFCEKLRGELLAAMNRGGWPVTVSFGVATFYTMPEDVDQLLKHSDSLMYAVKQAGKNQIKYEVVGPIPPAQ
jgi:diguanylate cyclase (GGDEF)-like protein